MRIPRLPVPRRFALLVLPLAVAIGVATWAERNGWLYHWFPHIAPPGLHLGGEQAVPLIRVSDGDTMAVRYHDMALTLRLLCVDTEESAHHDNQRNTDFGAETTAWAKSYLKDTLVRVEFQQKSWRIETDQYGRALAWLWIERGAPGPEDDELFNETLVRHGYSPYITTYGTAGRYHQRMLQAETQARQTKTGIWSE